MYMAPMHITIIIVLNYILIVGTYLVDSFTHYDVYNILSIGMTYKCIIYDYLRVTIAPDQTFPRGGLTGPVYLILHVTMTPRWRSATATNQRLLLAAADFVGLGNTFLQKFLIFFQTKLISASQ